MKPYRKYDHFAGTQFAGSRVTGPSRPDGSRGMFFVM